MASPDNMHSCVELVSVCFAFSVPSACTHSAFFVATALFLGVVKQALWKCDHRDSFPFRGKSSTQERRFKDLSPDLDALRHCRWKITHPLIPRGLYHVPVSEAHRPSSMRTRLGPQEGQLSASASSCTVSAVRSAVS